MFESHLKLWCFDALSQIIINPHLLSSYHGNLAEILDEHHSFIEMIENPAVNPTLKL